MSLNRITHDGATITPTLLAAPAPAAVALVACPVPAWGGGGSGGLVWAQSLYQIAYERALATSRPTFYDRLLVPGRN